MDLNQLYHDHQISLMRAETARNGESSRLHHANASTIALRIERIHRASGATALRNWEARYTSPGQQSVIARTIGGMPGHHCVQ